MVSGSPEATHLRTAAQFAGVELLPFQEYHAAVQALQAGQVDAVSAGHATLQATLRTTSGLRVVGEPVAQLAYAIGVPGGDSVLRDRVNATLQAMMVDGALAALHQTWLDGESPLAVSIWSGVVGASKVRIASSSATRTPALALTPAATPTGVAASVPTAARALVLLPTVTPSPALSPAIATYRVQAGDTLSTLAAQFYGDPLLWEIKYAANRAVIGANPNQMFAGTELIIPAPP